MVVGPRYGDGGLLDRKRLPGWHRQAGQDVPGEFHNSEVVGVKGVKDKWGMVIEGDVCPHCRLPIEKTGTRPGTLYQYDIFTCSSCGHQEERLNDVCLCWELM